MVNFVFSHGNPCNKLRRVAFREQPVQHIKLPDSIVIGSCTYLVQRQKNFDLCGWKAKLTENPEKILVKEKSNQKKTCGTYVRNANIEQRNRLMATIHSLSSSLSGKVAA